jgi:predicted DNA-binding transcriptional regulator YafY
MNRVDRLMGILTVLQSHKFVMAEKIASKFEISVRTVYRDIKALIEIGIPVSFETNRGYFIVQGYFLPPVSFTSNEANALILMTSLAERFADKSMAKHSANGLQKIRAVLRQADKERSEQWSDRIKVLNPHRLENNYLTEIQDAIISKTTLQIAYTDSEKRSTNREVEPIGIIYYTDQWHLIAWCWSRNDYRDFKVPRIGVLQNTRRPFRKKNHISIDEHIRSWK